MYTLLGEEQLKSGESLEIGVVAAPDAEFAPAITTLLVHKEPMWQIHMTAALQGRASLLETRFHVGFIGGAPVANVMTAEHLGVGFLGHVFTAPEHRRKGICQAIMRRVMEHFRERGGRVLLLGTGFESPPYWIYHSFGFRSVKRGFMRYDSPAAGDFEQSWFVPGAVSAAPFAWEHWPLVGLLGARNGGPYLRSALWRLYGAANLEGPAARLLAAQAEGAGTNGAVLRSTSGAVVGCATIHPTGGGINGWPGVWLLDAFTHSNFHSYLGELLGALKWPSEKIIAYVEAGDVDKARALEDYGLEREGTLREFLRSDDLARDAWLYGKTIK